MMSNNQEQAIRELLIDETHEFDERKFYGTYQDLKWRDQTLRHLGHHIAKAGYKLVEHNQGRVSDEVIIAQVIPDLAKYRTEIINLLEFDPGQVDWSAHPGEEFDVAQAILWSAGMVSRYVEPLEHDAADRHESLSTEDLFEVPVQLHMAAVALADRFKVDLVQAHRARMR